MENVEEGEATAPRGNEWEVVSLTASAYAAAPGPRQVDMSQDSQAKLVGENDVETSDAMLMSGHFVVPPSQLENLPVELEYNEIPNEWERKGDVSQLFEEYRGKSDVKDEENVSIEGVIADEFPERHTYYEKVDRFSASDPGFRTIVAFDNEQSIYSTSGYSLPPHEATMGKSNTIEKGAETCNSVEPTSGSGLPSFRKPARGDSYDGSGLPSEAWWKRHAISLYTHAKEANTFWSVFVAAAVMGLVVIGHQWQRERWQVLHLKWQSGIKDERMGRMLDPISRFKDAIVGGAKRGSLVRGSTSTEH